MTRKEFLGKLPIGAAFAFTIVCNASCSKDRLDMEVREDTLLRTDTIPDPNAPSVDFTIDLSSDEYKNLKNLGGYTFYEKVIIVRTESGDYIAASKICSDEFLPRMTWEEGEYLCDAHGATFDSDGNGTETYNDLGKKGLETFNTELLGNKLRVYSK